MINLNKYSFNKARWSIYTLLILSFMLGFFHRFAPAAFAESVRTEFHISATALGTLAAMHFYTYTAMQIPSGVIIDRFGVRLSVSAGAILAGIGSIVFGVSPNFIIASLGPLIVGLGVSTIFVGIMKNNTLWFPENNYGMISGVTMLFGNLGAALAAGPLAVLLEWFSWRVLFIVVGIASVILSILIYLIVRNSPEEAGFPNKEGYIQRKGTVSTQHWLKDLKYVLFKKDILFTLFAAIGTNSTFYAFSGLWGIPLLHDGFNLSNREAAIYTTVALVAYGLASLFIGWFSDKIGLRKPLIVIGNLLSLIGWIGLAIYPWSPGVSGLFLYILVGISASQVVVTFAVVKELVPSSISGMALAFLNAGVFLGVALLQPLFGWIMELNWNGKVIDGFAQYSFNDYIYGLLFYGCISLIGVVASFFVTETRCKNIVRHHSSVNKSS